MRMIRSIGMRFIAKPIRRTIRRILNYGSARFCPLCKSSVRAFLPYGQPPREDAKCPVCYSLERHRSIWMYFKERTTLLDGKPKQLLHVAPEPQLGSLLRRACGPGYLSVDLEPGAMLRADITDLPFDDGRFDVIYCSHVLEHVPDDRKAMSELSRVLRPGGWAVLQVPIKGIVTFEDSTVTTPEDRKRVFGQSDHVRIYGLDYRDRLEEVGFKVTIVKYTEEQSEEDIRLNAISRGEDIYLCEK